MTNKVFIDSSVLIGSEYLYKYIGLQNLGAPRTVQSDKKIAEALQPYLITNILEEFLFLDMNRLVVLTAPILMSEYNLLPNDAIILATCKFYGIEYLASHDKDYDIPCKAEGITLLTE